MIRYKIRFHLDKASTFKGCCLGQDTALVSPSSRLRKRRDTMCVCLNMLTHENLIFRWNIYRLTHEILKPAFWPVNQTGCPLPQGHLLILVLVTWPTCTHTNTILLKSTSGLSSPLSVLFLISTRLSLLLSALKDTTHIRTVGRQYAFTALNERERLRGWARGERLKEDEREGGWHPEGMCTIIRRVLGRVYGNIMQIQRRADRRKRGDCVSIGTGVIFCVCYWKNLWAQCSSGIRL